MASFRASRLSEEFYLEEEENNKKITFKGAGAYFTGKNHFVDVVVVVVCE